MKITQTGHKEYLLEHNGKQRILSFLSDTCLRLREVDVPSSFGVIPHEPTSDGVIIQNDETGLYIGFHALRIDISDEFLFKATFNGKVVLNEVPFVQKGPSELAKLAAAEGHAVSSSGEAAFGLSFENSDPVYGLGDKPGPLDRRGYEYKNLNTDCVLTHCEMTRSIYKSVNFFMMHREECTVGVFLDDTYTTHFDFNKTNSKLVSVSASGGKMDIYFFFGTMGEVIRSYTALTGRNPLPPRWGFGVMQCRWSYMNKDEVDTVVESYKKADIPLSAVFLDIDYMDHYKDFTVDETKFPFFDFWVEKKKKEGVQIVPIIDAGVKAESGYSVYDSGILGNYFSKQGNDIYHNRVWPGDSVFPSFLSPTTQNWWSDLVANFLKTGIGGVWNDMNEPASFDGPLPPDVDIGGLSHEAGHNVYGHCMNKATYDGFIKAGKRPFIVTRAAYSGTQRYACSWTGDNQSIYEHIRLAIPQICSMSLSGFTFTGVDIGGFSGDTTPELLSRWVVASLFNPLFRNHSAMGTVRQEPYALGERTKEIYRDVANLRMEILPTLYDQFFLHEKTGSIPVRPLVYNYPHDPRVQNENTEIMLGDSLLLAPSLFAGQEKRAVYFPDVFFDFFTGKRYEQGDHLIDASLGVIPLFIRQNSLVVLNPKGAKNCEFGDTLRLLWTGGEASVYHYEDAGDGLGYRNGEYNLRLISVSADGELKRTYLHEGMPSPYKKIELTLLGGDTIVENR